MSYSISYGIDNLSSITSPSNIINNTYIVSGTNIIDTSFNLELNYNVIPSNIMVTYSITVIRIE
jgi:hypothetical protein